MSDIIVIKIGSSTLVDADGRLRDNVLRARVAEVAALRARGLHPVLVSSGAIACGLGVMGIASRPAALPDLQAASAVGQGALFARYSDAFAAHAQVPAQVLLTSADLEQRTSYINARNTLERLMQFGVIPVINENDTTATDELTFGDNDVLAAQVAILLRARLLLMLTDRDGLYGPGTSGPELIHEVPAGTRPEDVALAMLPGSGIGTGGIASKVAAASIATGCGVMCVIASGRDDGVITSVVGGEPVGTRFPASSAGEGSFKMWIRHAKPSMGSITIDAGAVRALLEKGTSLLPVGVTDCDGGFRSGDAVMVLGPDGREVGKGITELSHDEVRKVLGMRSDAAREVLPGASSEIIHRDRLAVAGSEGAVR